MGTYMKDGRPPIFSINEEDNIILKEAIEVAFKANTNLFELALENFGISHKITKKSHTNKARILDIKKDLEKELENVRLK